MKSVPTNLPFPLLYGSVDLTLTSELISNLISYKPEKGTRRIVPPPACEREKTANDFVSRVFSLPGLRGLGGLSGLDALLALPAAHDRTGLQRHG